MHTTAVNKLNIIEKFNKQIELSNSAYQDWKIGIASLERISRLEVKEVIVYQFCDIDTSKKFYLILSLKVCKHAK